MEFNKKEMDITFDKFLKNSAIIIDKRHRSNMKKINPSYQGKTFEEMKNIFDLDVNLEISTFKTKYIKKDHPTEICKENVIKMIYLLIFKTQINSKKDLEIEVNNIINIVKKLENDALPFPKKYLVEKLKKMKKIKLSKPIEANISIKLDNSLNTFEKNTELNTKKAKAVIDLMTEFMGSNLEDKQKSEKLDHLCKILTEKISNSENKENSQNLYKFSENIIPNLKKLRTEITLEKNYKKEYYEKVTNCIENCKKIQNELMSEKEKFKQIEKARKNSSHNKESLQHFFEIQKSTIAQANKIINQIKYIKPIDESELPKLKNCEKFLNRPSSTENLKKEIFDSYVEEMEKETKNIISGRLKQTMFGEKAPSSQKILSEILKLF